MPTNDSNLVGMIVAAIARHVLTGLAGTLVTLGWIGNEQSANFVTIGCGIAVGVASLAWSWWQKVGHQRALEILGQFKAKGAAPAAKAVIVLCLLALAAPAFAQPAATTLQARLAQFEQITIADLEAAVKIFDTAGNTSGKLCAAAWLGVAKANAAVDATQLPKLHIFADVAKLYNIHVAFQSGAPVRTACAAMKDDILNSGGGILGGVTLLKKFLPAIGLLGL